MLCDRAGLRLCVLQAARKQRDEALAGLQGLPSTSEMAAAMATMNKVVEDMELALDGMAAIGQSL